MLKRFVSILISITTGLLASAAVLALAQHPAGIAWAAPEWQPLATTFTVGVGCATIQACIDAASPGDEVHIPPGLYTESVTVNKDISVTGDLSSTTIIYALDNQRVMTITGASVYLADVMLTGGVFTSTGIDYSTNCGGGLRIYAAGPAVLHNVAIISNTAYCGGGLGAYGGAVTLDGVEILSNTAGVGGGVSVRYILMEFMSGNIQNNVGTNLAGGIEQQFGNVTMSGGEIFSNSTDYFGGGVVVFGQGAVFTQTGGTIVGNTAKQAGGGLENDAGTVRLLGGSVLSNSAAEGAGIASFSETGAPASVSLDGGQVTSNTTTLGGQGGGIYINGSSGASSYFTQTAGSIERNTALEAGGLRLVHAQAWLAGGDIAFNSANDGAGVFLQGGGSVFTQTGGTIAGNLATGSGGGIASQGSSVALLGGSVTSNTAQNAAGIFSASGNFPGGRSDIVLAGGHVASNTANGEGGGFWMYGANGFFTYTAGTLEHNMAITGGGVYLTAGASAWLFDADIQSNSAITGGGVAVIGPNSQFAQSGGRIAYNSAASIGGGIYLGFTGSVTVSISGGLIMSNAAGSSAGGFAIDRGLLVITDTRLLSNTGSSGAGAITQFSSGAPVSVTVANSCIAGNGPITSVANALGPTIDARGNWWGTAAGPSGAGPGSGDAVSSGVNFSGFLSVPPVADCGVSIADLSVSRTGTGSGTIASTPSGINCGVDCSETFLQNTVVTLTATPGVSSTFAGWSGACSGSGACIVTMTATTQVTATFNLKVYLLTAGLAGNGGGSVTSVPAGIACGNLCGLTFDYGTVVSLTATPALSSTFAGWSGACGGAGACVVTITRTTAVTATFALKAYTLTVGSAGNGAGTVTSLPAGISCGITCGASFNYGTVISLSAQPNASSNFTGWQGACAGSGGCVVTLTAPSQVTATFALKSYTVTVVLSGTGSGAVTSVPAGVACGSACAASFAHGTALTLTAVPTVGSDFAGWNGGCSGTGLCGLVVTQAMTLTATFNIQPPHYKLFLPLVANGAAPQGAAQGTPAGLDGSSVILPAVVGLRRRKRSRTT